MTAAAPATKPAPLQRIPCTGRTDWDPFYRTTRCRFPAEYIALPSETAVCLAHAFDSRFTRDITPLDVTRARCPDCAAVETYVESLSKAERRARYERGERRPRWCRVHREAPR